MREEAMLLRIQGYEPLYPEELQELTNRYANSRHFQEGGIEMNIAHDLFFIYGGECVPIKKGAEVFLFYDTPRLVCDKEYLLSGIECYEG